MDTIINGAVIIGVVNLISLAFPKITSLQKIVVAIIIGGILPFLPNLGSAMTGIELALATSGIYKIGQKLGGK